MTAEHAVSRFVHMAMELHHLNHKSLSDAVGCSEKSILNIIDEQPVKLTQAQYFNLFALAGVLNFA